MFDIIRSYLDKESFYLLILKDGLYIKNYEKLLGITEGEVMLQIASNLYQIKGSHLILTKSIDQELMIKGSIESVNRL